MMGVLEVYEWGTSGSSSVRITAWQLVSMQSHGPRKYVCGHKNFEKTRSRVHGSIASAALVTA